MNLRLSIFGPGSPNTGEEISFFPRCENGFGAGTCGKGIRSANSKMFASVTPVCFQRNSVKIHPHPEGGGGGEGGGGQSGRRILRAENQD